MDIAVQRCSDEVKQRHRQTFQIFTHIPSLLVNHRY